MVGREHHSHAERLHREHSQHETHVLERRVEELERDVVQLLYERDKAIAERDKARDMACFAEEKYNQAMRDWTLVING
jgi:cytochrome c-type biogenesis protein CcmH/NrfG